MEQDIADLKAKLDSLQLEVHDMKTELSHPSTCLLYIRFEKHVTQQIDKEVLNNTLQSPVLWYRIIQTNPFICKARIRTSHIHKVLTVGQQNVGLTVTLWHSLPTPSAPLLHSKSISVDNTCNPASRKLCITTWNARGLKSGEPYLNHLSQRISDVIVVTEHWLWPYEAQKLSHVNEDFAAEVVIDKRLNENSTLKQGCGGVGLLWRKSLDAVPIPGIESDRICGIRIKLSTSPSCLLTILGVYLPCADQGIHVFSDHLIELERLVTEAQHHGLVAVLGDFNAHLGCLGGVRGSGHNPNPQGLLIKEWADRCQLYAVSMSASAVGPDYTYFSGENRTTVDYIFTDAETAQFLDSCYTHDLHGLNTSDHLPISVLFSLPTMHLIPKERTQRQVKINWEQAISTGSLHSYQKLVKATLVKIIGRCYNTVEELNDEIKIVTSWMLLFKFYQNKNLLKHKRNGTEIQHYHVFPRRRKEPGTHG